MRTSAYKRPQGKGSPAVSYYPKGMLVRGGGKGRDGGGCEGPPPRAPRASAAKGTEKARPHALRVHL